MKIYRVVVGPIQENCYIIKNEENNQGIIVDPGDEANRIMDAVQKAGIEKVPAIFITHGHGDHVSALDEVKDATGAIRCVMFRGQAMRLRFRPENGMKVLVTGRVSVFPRDGVEQQPVLFHQPGQKIRSPR